MQRLLPEPGGLLQRVHVHAVFAHSCPVLVAPALKQRLDLGDEVPQGIQHPPGHAPVFARQPLEPGRVYRQRLGEVCRDLVHGLLGGQVDPALRIPRLVPLHKGGGGPVPLRQGRYGVVPVGPVCLRRNLLEAVGDFVLCHHLARVLCVRRDVDGPVVVPAIGTARAGSSRNGNLGPGRTGQGIVKAHCVLGQLRGVFAGNKASLVPVDGGEPYALPLRRQAGSRVVLPGGIGRVLLGVVQRPGVLAADLAHIHAGHASLIIGRKASVELARIHAPVVCGGQRAAAALAQSACRRLNPPDVIRLLRGGPFCSLFGGGLCGPLRPLGIYPRVSGTGALTACKGADVAFNAADGRVCVDLLAGQLGQERHGLLILRDAGRLVPADLLAVHQHFDGRAGGLRDVIVNFSGVLALFLRFLGSRFQNSAVFGGVLLGLLLVVAVVGRVRHTVYRIYGPAHHTAGKSAAHTGLHYLADQVHKRLPLRVLLRHALGDVLPHGCVVVGVIPHDGRVSQDVGNLGEGFLAGLDARLLCRFFQPGFPPRHTLGRQQIVDAHFLKNGLERSGGQAAHKRLPLGPAPVDDVLCLVGCGGGTAHHQRAGRTKGRQVQCAVPDAHSGLIQKGCHILAEQFPVGVFLDVLGNALPHCVDIVGGVHGIAVHGDIVLRVVGVPVTHVIQHHAGEVEPLERCHQQAVNGGKDGMLPGILLPLLQVLLVTLRVLLHLGVSGHALIVVPALCQRGHGLFFLFLQFQIQVVDVVVSSICPGNIGSASPGDGVLVDGLLVQAVFLEQVVLVLLHLGGVPVVGGGVGHDSRHLVHVRLDVLGGLILRGHRLVLLERGTLFLVLGLVVSGEQVVVLLVIPGVVRLRLLQPGAPLVPLALCHIPGPIHYGARLVPLLLGGVPQFPQFIHARGHVRAAHGGAGRAGLLLAAPGLCPAGRPGGEELEGGKGEGGGLPKGGHDRWPGRGGGGGGALLPLRSPRHQFPAALQVSACKVVSPRGGALRALGLPGLRAGGRHPGTSAAPGVGLVVGPPGQAGPQKFTPPLQVSAGKVVGPCHGQLPPKSPRFPRMPNPVFSLVRFVRRNLILPFST